MTTTICKEFRFEAAHSLPNHAGKCRGVHGHSYRVVVEISGTPSRCVGESDEGMVVDFGDVKRVWATCCEPLLDHQFLNDSIGDQLEGPSTAENIAQWIFDQMDVSWESSGTIVPLLMSVSVWETATGCATVRR